jgi:septal ring factor EnvC (AmiA/AmiB activator)
LRNQRLTAQQIAEEATKAVGAMVTRNNVVSACRALEFSLPKSSINRVSKARRRIQELEAKVGELEARLSHLEAQLGVTAKVA